MKAAPEFGSDRWVEWVFSNPPTDRIRGRTRWTQAHLRWVPSMERFAAVQGRLEYIALLCLEYLQLLGIVARFKQQPFSTDASNVGWETRPDFLAVTQDQSKLVIELKTARFITAAVEKELQANREAFRRYGITYLVWTDRQPLARPVRHNLMQMRRCGAEDVTEAELVQLQHLAANCEKLTLQETLSVGIDLGCIYSAWWQGKIFLPLAELPSAATRLSRRPLEDYQMRFLSSTPIQDDWWSALPTG